ncbi:ketopantoate reductase family protein [Enhygromyxa salina]|uniref:2-dehydropantoate 2-reductase n=1 Tax=Enhygromyxa salina TaxID=215803 RepID=A0A2S9Y0I4_9BACT|nr:ketopantoate reductase C-terminal domain-containing protein [Enhygromyxa salina]PRP98627.1 2-dehydropantoate 2-reductase [Enhygromyxa salina]
MIVVIGAGRIGGALHQRDPHQFALVDRQQGWELLEREPGEPILLAVRNDDLLAVLERVPERRRADLVFAQNGMLRPWLREHGLTEVTRGLLFVAVPTRGAPIEPGGESPFFGPHAATMVQAFTRVGLPAAVVSADAFAAVELEKLIWNCAFGLCCEAFDCDVGTVVRDHAEQLRALVAELLEVGAPALGVELELGPLVNRLCDYSRSIPSYRGAVKEWPWRNGWFVETAREQGRATPTHAQLLARVGRG